MNGPCDDCFVDAVTDALRTDLSRLADAMVIAGACAFTYKIKSVDARRSGWDPAYAGPWRQHPTIGTRVQAHEELIDIGPGRAAAASPADDRPKADDMR